MIAYNDISAITEVYYGSQSISEVYCSHTKVFPVDTPPTPTGGTKLSCIISGDTYTIDCNSSSTLTVEESIIGIPNRLRITEAHIGDCVTELGDNLFNRCQQLTSVTIPNSVTIIGNNVFWTCRNLTGIDIPSGVTDIGNGAFQGCYHISAVTIPSVVTTIGIGSFCDCSRLLDVVIPSGVTVIESDAFLVTDMTSDADEQQARIYTVANRRVYIYATTPPSVGLNSFESTVANVPATYPIYVPSESVELYKTSGNWVYYADRIQAM